MVVLQIAYPDVVAADSIRAITIRIIVRLVIPGQMVVQARRGRSALT